jgi:signal peptidase I
MAMANQLAPAPRHAIAEWVVTIVTYLFATTSLLQAFVVPTSSMDGTLKIGDHLLVDKLAYAPPDATLGRLLPYAGVKRGDIIVFRYPPDIRETYVKRCMGVPGDRIRMVDKRLWVNGHTLEEPYVQHIDPGLDPVRDNFPPPPGGIWPSAEARGRLLAFVKGGEVVVPPGSYFALGDNRDNSADSRYWGFVPRENIVGKPLAIYWSYDAPTEHLLSPTPGVEHVADLVQHFFTKTRWERTFRLVRGYPVTAGDATGATALQ